MSGNGLPEPCQTSNELKILLKPLEKLLWTSYIDGCLENGLFCDVFFQCDDAVVGAHRIVVASASSHLAKMLKEINQEQVTIILPGIQAQIMNIYLRLIYGERIVVRKSFLEDLHSKFKGIDVALGIAHLRVSKRNTRGKVLNDLDLNQNANAVRCASCEVAFNLNQTDQGGVAIEETQSEMQLNQQEIEASEEKLDKSLEENGKSDKEANGREIPVEGRLVTSSPQRDETKTQTVPMSCSDLQENGLESQIEKPTHNFSNNERCKIINNEKSLGIIGKKVISKNKNIKRKRKLKKVLKTTILSEKCSKKALENLNKSSVEVLIVKNENFNIDALRQVERLKSVTNPVIFCKVCLKEFSCDKSLKHHSKIHTKSLGNPTIRTDDALDPDYGRPADWKPKLKFNCKTWNLPLTLLTHSGAACFTCAICQRRLFGKEKANYHVYENHYHELCTLAGDSIPLQIRPDFTKKIRAMEAFKKERQLKQSSQNVDAKENQDTTTSSD